jgi:hypothetical protein
MHSLHYFSPRFKPWAIYGKYRFNGFNHLGQGKNQEST